MRRLILVLCFLLSAACVSPREAAARGVVAVAAGSAAAQLPAAASVVGLLAADFAEVMAATAATEVMALRGYGYRGGWGGYYGGWGFAIGPATPIPITVLITTRTVRLRYAYPYGAYYGPAAYDGYGYGYAYPASGYVSVGVGIGGGWRHFGR